MADILFLGLLAAFFAVAVLLVRACERIVGTDDALLPEPVGVADEVRAA